MCRNNIKTTRTQMLSKQESNDTQSIICFFIHRMKPFVTDILRVIDTEFHHVNEWNKWVQPVYSGWSLFHFFERSNVLALSRLLQYPEVFFSLQLLMSQSLIGRVQTAQLFEYVLFQTIFLAFLTQVHSRNSKKEFLLVQT